MEEYQTKDDDQEKEDEEAETEKEIDVVEDSGESGIEYESVNNNEDQYKSPIALEVTSPAKEKTGETWYSSCYEEPYKDKKIN